MSPEVLQQLMQSTVLFPRLEMLPFSWCELNTVNYNLFLLCIKKDQLWNRVSELPHACVQCKSITKFLNKMYELERNKGSIWCNWLCMWKTETQCGQETFYWASWAWTLSPYPITGSLQDHNNAAIIYMGKNKFFRRHCLSVDRFLASLDLFDCMFCD